MVPPDSRTRLPGGRRSRTAPNRNGAAQRSRPPRPVPGGTRSAGVGPAEPERVEPGWNRLGEPKRDGRTPVARPSLRRFRTCPRRCGTVPPPSDPGGIGGTVRCRAIVETASALRQLQPCSRLIRTAGWHSIRSRRPGDGPPAARAADWPPRSRRWPMRSADSDLHPLPRQAEEPTGAQSPPEGASFGASTADGVFDAGWLLAQPERRKAEEAAPPGTHRNARRGYDAVVYGWRRWTGNSPAKIGEHGAVAMRHDKPDIGCAACRRVAAAG